MSTAALHLGPADHGRELSYDHFLAADAQEGYRYEIIDGAVYVSPFPELCEVLCEQHIADCIKKWSRANPGIIGFVAVKASVFVMNRLKPTVPRPDLTVFRETPEGPHQRWEDFTPLIVAEVMQASVKKDLVRNVELYAEIPTILEYWILDLRAGARHPILHVFRRDSGDEPWSTAQYPSDAIYTTPLLPGFELPVTPRW
jgi:Uma2 family endonuclease